MILLSINFIKLNLVLELFLATIKTPEKDVWLSIFGMKSVKPGTKISQPWHLNRTYQNQDYEG
jgi:hypothetical protein